MTVVENLSPFQLVIIKANCFTLVKLWNNLKRLKKISFFDLEARIFFFESRWWSGFNNLPTECKSINERLERRLSSSWWNDSFVFQLKKQFEGFRWQSQVFLFKACRRVSPRLYSWTKALKQLRLNEFKVTKTANSFLILSCRWESHTWLSKFFPHCLL